MSEWFGEEFASFDEKTFFGHFLTFEGQFTRCRKALEAKMVLPPSPVPVLCARAPCPLQRLCVCVPQADTLCRDVPLHVAGTLAVDTLAHVCFPPL